MSAIDPVQEAHRRFMEIWETGRYPEPEEIENYLADLTPPRVARNLPEPSFTDPVRYTPPPVVMCTLCLSRFQADGLEHCPGCGAPDWEWYTVAGFPERC